MHNLNKGPQLEPPSTRRVKQSLRAWQASPSKVVNLTFVGPVAPIGEPIAIERFEEIQVLRRVKVAGEYMALILWHDAPYLVTEDDLDHRTMTMLRFR